MSGWVMRWFTARAVIGCGEAFLPWRELEEAVLRAPMDETKWVRVTPASSSLIEVKALTRARHGGAACSRLADMLAAAAPHGWDWASAVVEAEPMKEGVRRWPRLAVVGGTSEADCASAAVNLASKALAVMPDGEAGPALLEVLRMCGLTVSAQ